MFHQLNHWWMLKEVGLDWISAPAAAWRLKKAPISANGQTLWISFGLQILRRLSRMIDHVNGTRSPVVDIS
ncbi:MAG: tRNA-2-methylthio-N(6)-dimethylallyladenosine synthase [Sodalis sp.]|nr:MAG: tRNA-2-methylthio-N(6)-dimethylallyladenosine synthase [Sodalis sp.]